MKTVLFTKDKVERLDDMVLNLFALRADLLHLPGPVVAEILKRAQTDLIFIIEGFKDAWEK